KRWFLEYYGQTGEHVAIDYQAIGSGAGERQFKEGLTDFGASDAPKNVANDVLTIPMTAGSVALAYNLPGLPPDSGVRLSRQALVEILFGRITHWNDPQLQELNPGLPLPERRITWVRRSEGSGTTYAFTNHVGAVSAEWKKGPGVNKSITWPTGVGAKGNDGVAALIQQTPGALG